MAFILDNVTRPLGILSESVVFALLPFVVWLAFMRDVRWYYRLLFIALYGLLIASCIMNRADYLSMAGVAVAGMTYYLLLAVIVHRLPPLLRSRAIDETTLFAGSAAVYILLPSLVAPTLASVTFLAIGWKLILSTYSYCVDNARVDRRVSLRDCLFFLLVNPVLVFAMRGTRRGAAGLTLSSIARVVVGLASLYGSHLIREMPKPSTGFYAWGTEYVGVLVSGSIAFLSLYLVHSGVASVRIGIMRTIGYDIPEQYNYPFLARNPLDFWRRWNTYVGTWCRLYLFYPLVARCRHIFGCSLSASKGLAVVGTFIAIGFLHDIFTWTASFRLSFDGLQLFLVALSAIFLWAGIGRLVSLFRFSTKSKWITPLANNLSRLFLLQAIFLILYRFPR